MGGQERYWGKRNKLHLHTMRIYRSMFKFVILVAISIPSLSPSQKHPEMWGGGAGE